jgi:hypothetical protein
MVMYRSSIVIERIDEIIMSGNSPTIEPPYFMQMVSEALCSPIEQVWRVKFNENNTAELYSFAIPMTEKNLPAAKRLNTAALPQWVRDRVSVLQICEQGDIVEGVGQKVSERIYYVIE